ncbi:MFS transporter [Bacillus sp. 165]|uniref:MDR family MFS transporter n=1 Tax=Bacillus sp. 165 TaxID=1529117 RepID=UPI001ADB934F|nr:MFS transporter [Bacillus sp. 165]MBO9129045.1 MFS transporter [Bacillus sp. 165]
MGSKLASVHPIGWNIIIGTLFARLASSMSMPFLAIYLTSTKGVSPAMTGMIIAVSALVGVFSSFIGGSLSDQYGRKRIMLSSIGVWIFVFIGFAFADRIVWFFVLNALNGICRSFFEPTSRALLSDITKQENKLLIFNLRYAAINAGVAVGPLIGLQLGSAKSTMPFLIAAGVNLVYMLSLLLQFKKYEIGETIAAPKTRVSLKQSLQILGKDTVFLLALIGIILGNAGYSQFSSTLSQYFANAPAFHDGVQLFSHILVLNAVTVLIVQYPVTRVGKKYSALVSIMLGIFIVSLGLLGFGMLQSVPLLFACAILFTIGEVLMFSMSDLFIDQIALPHLKGTYFGAMGFAGFGGVIGPWLGGMLLDAYGYGSGSVVFSYLAFLCVLGFPMLFFVKIMLQKRSSQNDTIKMHA